MCKCNQKKCGCKVIVTLFIVFAVLVGILANIDDHQGIIQKIVSSVVLFFDAMVTILAAAALIKFLLAPCKTHHHEKNNPCLNDCSKNQ